MKNAANQATNWPLITAAVLDRDAIGWVLVGVLTTIILAVSIDDVYWSFKTQQVLHESEQNPIGRWLIQLDGGDVALFMTLKMVGTMIVISAIPIIYAIRRWAGLTVATVLGTFQVLLFIYLNFGDALPIFGWL